MPETGSPPLHSVSWQDFDAMIQTLVSQLRASQINPDCIVGIARGGCVVAVALNHALPSAEFCVIQAQVHASDSIRAQKTPVQVQSLAGTTEFGGRKVLMVDDALHTGATARACHAFIIRSRPAAVYFAALLQDTFNVSEPTMLLPCPTITAGSVHAWIIFPWERTFN
jgi:uncharacterized protein